MRAQFRRTHAGEIGPVWRGGVDRRVEIRRQLGRVLGWQRIDRRLLIAQGRIDTAASLLPRRRGTATARG
ncbi:MAG: hypothetical protein KGI51_12670, partial [Rhodospirillales bacterium]|nr:hypothetical protein [Rhodospirillales bacterium]